ncbi:MAG: metal ABC transporter ATP-binding protein [Parachlamydia sp.]|nr:metal ABC transporter ATP-binding protein [Parachlamydia sp.]
MTAIVSFDHVYFSYQDTSVLTDVSFKVTPGEFLGIIGPNGGGKTTLLKLILGFLKPKSGAISVLDAPPGTASTRIAYVSQGLNYDRQFPISVKELVLSGRLSSLPWYGAYAPEDLQAAQNALEKVGMQDFSNHPFGKLSGGQAQRALIARALVTEPDLLLLDEPTASVDTQAEGAIYDILKSLRKTMTILMVTHDLRAAIDIVDRVLCVQGGLTSLLPQEVCEHFALGLYHTPLQIGTPPR